VLEKISTFLIVFLLSFSASAESLRELIEVGLQSHPSVSAEEYRVASGEADMKTARWQYYPTLALQFNTGDRSSAFSERSFSDSFEDLDDNNTTTVSLEQPLWTGGRLRGGLDRANAAFRDASGGLEQSRQNVALEIVQAYGDWLSAILRVKGWQESLAIHRELIATVTRRFEEGLASNSDRLLAESRLNSVVADLVEAQAGERVALSSLSQLVGREMASSSIDIEDILPETSEDIEGLIEAALSLSPAVTQAQAQTEVAQADVLVQRSSTKPAFFVRIEHEFGTSVSQQSFKDSRILFGVRTAFGAGLSSFSAADSSRATYQSSLSALEASRRIVREQVQREYFLKSSFESRLQSLRDSLSSSEEVFASYRRQFLEGRKTWFDLLNSARDLAQSSNLLADAEAAYLVTTWRLAILTNSLNELVH